MPVFLSPGVFPREIDLSVLPSGVGPLTPAFVGVAKKGPLNEPTLVTSGAQYVDIFGEPFTESYLGYAVLNYLTEGNSCWVVRVGVEFDESLPDEVQDDAIDTSGSREQGWARTPVFTGLDNGKINLRPITTDSPVVFHLASVKSQSFNDADGDGANYSLEFSSEDYSGDTDETFYLRILSGPTGSGNIDGATYEITDSDGFVVDNGTLTSSVVGESDTITLSDENLAFKIKNDGTSTRALEEGDLFTFAVQPDNTELNITVEENDSTLTFSPATITSNQDFIDTLDALLDALPGDEDFIAIEVENENGEDVVQLRTNDAGSWIQVRGTSAFAIEVGISAWTFDIPRSFLIGTEPGPYKFRDSNNRVILDVIGDTDTETFDFRVPTGDTVSTSALASTIDSNGDVDGDTFFKSFELTVPGGTKHVVIITDQTHNEAQLKLDADFTNLSVLRFADTTGILFPYTKVPRNFSDERLLLPEQGDLDPSTPLSCELDPLSSQCTIDSEYYENIVGWFVAKSAGTWANELSIRLEVFDEGLEDAAGRFVLSILDDDDDVLDQVQDITFDPSDDRYVGNVINEESPIGGQNGNRYVQWVERPSVLGTDVRVPGAFGDQNLSGGANGIPSEPEFSALLDSAVIGNSAESKGLFALQNAEVFDFNLLAAPGFSSGPVIAQGLQFCENRGDCLYLVDPPFGLRPQQVIDWHNGMLLSDLASALNTSYGALYWGWLRMPDQFAEGTQNTIWVPPSGHVASIFARTARVGEQWFAPAGLNRGNVRGVLEVEYNPSNGERDALYGFNNAVNPIVNFAQDGIVVWGQRTLQRQDSALDRVNVRMLLIFLKKNLRSLLRNFIFEVNDEVLREQVEGAVNDFLSDIAGRRGLTAFNVVVDETNNTPERIDRNELWVSVFIQPTRVAEFVALNLVILRTGANFGAQEVLAAGGVVNQ